MRWKMKMDLSYMIHIVKYATVVAICCFLLVHNNIVCHLEDIVDANVSKGCQCQAAAHTHNLKDASVATKSSLKHLRAKQAVAVMHMEEGSLQQLVQALIAWTYPIWVMTQQSECLTEQKLGSPRQLLDSPV